MIQYIDIELNPGPVAISPLHVW